MLNFVRAPFPAWRCYRSWIRGVLLALMLIGLVVLFKDPSPAQIPTPEIRGVWLTVNDTEILVDRTKVREAVTKLAQLNFNTIYPVVWNAGYATYPSEVVKRAGIQSFVRKGRQGQDTLADLIEQAHRQGLLVVPWFEFGFMAPPTSELALKHPDWLTQRRDGGKTIENEAGEVAWLNPFHPEVQQFITDLVLEVVTNYDVDGIQFDDHMSLPNQLGYDPYTSVLYSFEALQMPPPRFDNPSWVRWRANKLTQFIARLNQEVKARKPNILFALSPNYYDFAYKVQLQDWLTWLRLNLIDELVVQIYRPTLKSFNDVIDLPELREARQKIPTGVGILAGLRNRPVPIHLIQGKMQAARDRRLGMVFFFYESLWKKSPEDRVDRKSRFRALFSVPARRYPLGR